MIRLQNVRCVVVCSYLLLVLGLSLPMLTLAKEQSFTDAMETSLVVSSEVAVDKDEVQKSEILVIPEIEIDLPMQSKLTGIARIRADADKSIDPDDQTDVELRELYLQTDIGRSLWTLGKQQVVWGKADGLKVLDVVNPRDFREFILDDFDNARIPLWMVNAEIPIEDVTLQLLWIPDQTYHKFASTKGLYAFRSSTLVPTVPADVVVDLQNPTEPDHRFGDADWGFRLSSFWKGWDLSANYLYHYSDTPVLFRELSTTPTGVKATMTPRYERSHLIGGTFSNAFGDLTLRGELGYSTDRYISTNDATDSDGIVKNNELAYVMGLDWYGFSDSLVSLQFFQTRLSQNKKQMIRDGLDSTLTLLLKRVFLNDTLSSEILWLHNIDMGDGLLRPKVSYDLNDEIQLWLGVDVFYGDDDGLFGQFTERDRFVSGIEISL